MKFDLICVKIKCSPIPMLPNKSGYRLPNTLTAPTDKINNTIIKITPILKTSVKKINRNQTSQNSEICRLQHSSVRKSPLFNYIIVNYAQIPASSPLLNYIIILLCAMRRFQPRFPRSSIEMFVSPFKLLIISASESDFFRF